MLTGRDALRRMDTTLQTARRDLERLDNELQESSRALSKNKLEQARAIDRMAAVRLDAARRGEFVAHLESATQEAREILSQRSRALTAIRDRVGVAGNELDELERSRETVHDEVDQAAQVLAEREAAVQGRLEEDTAFQAQLERTRSASAVAVSAVEKAEFAAEDRQRKGEPFESDELFMYLWQRSYGTSEYSANPLARLLDAWVARLCGFREARANYWMLLEIPKRLAEHAEHARDNSESELDRLQAIEEEAAKAGDVPPARAELEAAERRQDELDAGIDAAEQRLDELHAEQGRYAAGEDDYLFQALRVFSAALETRDVGDLTKLARATMTPEDDAQVGELEHLRKESDDLEAEMREHRELQDERVRRVRGLQEVRRDFKMSRFDDLHSRFKKGDAIERMIRDVISGAIQGHALWRALRRNQRYNDAAGEWPDFGSGGVIRPKVRRRSRASTRKPTWHWPGPRAPRKPGGFKIPRSSGRTRSRGGFRTGGGI